MPNTKILQILKQVLHILKDGYQKDVNKTTEIPSGVSAKNMLSVI